LFIGIVMKFPEGLAGVIQDHITPRLKRYSSDKQEIKTDSTLNKLETEKGI